MDSLGIGNIAENAWGFFRDKEMLKTREEQNRKTLEVQANIQKSQTPETIIREIEVINDTNNIDYKKIGLISGIGLVGLIVLLKFL